MNDKELQRKVEDELTWEPSVTAAAIGVTVRERRGDPHRDGAVLCREVGGGTRDQAGRRRPAVAEDLKVQPTGSGQRTDTDIAAAAVQALQWRSWVPNQVTVKV